MAQLYTTLNKNINAQTKNAKLCLPRMKYVFIGVVNDLYTQVWWPSSHWPLPVRLLTLWVIPPLSCMDHNIEWVSQCDQYTGTPCTGVNKRPSQNVHFCHKATDDQSLEHLWKVLDQQVCSGPRKHAPAPCSTAGGMRQHSTGNYRNFMNSMRLRCTALCDANSVLSALNWSHELCTNCSTSSFVFFLFVLCIQFFLSHSDSINYSQFAVFHPACLCIYY